MNVSTKHYKTFFIGLLFNIFLFAVLPPEFVFSTLLFVAISYGGITLIKLATSYDSKMKKVDKT